jgi:ribosomal protein L33
MASKGPRINTGLVCTVCGAFNYLSEYNKNNERLKKQTTGEETFPLKKYCSRCQKHTEHKKQDKTK